MPLSRSITTNRRDLLLCLSELKSGIQIKDTVDNELLDIVQRIHDEDSEGCLFNLHLLFQHEFVTAKATLQLIIEQKYGPAGWRDVKMSPDAGLPTNIIFRIKLVRRDIYKITIRRWYITGKSGLEYTLDPGCRPVMDYLCDKLSKTWNYIVS